MAKGENPQTRSKRYAGELKQGKNSFTGEPLTKAQAGFRMGVLNERKWSGKIYKHKQSGTNYAAGAKSKPKRTSAKK